MKQLERLYLPAVALLVLVIAAGAGLLLYRAASGDAGMELTVATPPARSQQVKVSVTGAVARPGVYVLQNGATLEEALRAAEGATADADLAYVNLSRRARDGDQLHIPRSGEAPQRVNINTADPWLLEALPGIGEELAKRIVDYRLQNGYFTRVEDLKLVKGVSPAIFEKLKDLIAVN